MTVRPSSQSGFSIIEVALVMIIGGILLSMFSGTLITMISSAKMETTQERMRAINDALQLYASANNRLPCVASRTIAVNAPAASNYGREVSCSGGAAAGTVQTSGSNGAIRIGFVPTRTLNIPDETGYDAWGSRIIYAVSENLASTSSYDLKQGRIRVNDGLGVEVTSGSNATYVIYSVGPDRRGGYGTSGTPIISTPVPAAPCSTTSVDRENCDDDAVFVSTMMTGDSNTNTHYDDYLIYEGNFQASIIPAGALLAFDRTECPSGWTEHAPLQGRIIVGRGTFTESGPPPTTTNGVTGTKTFAAGETGGWASRQSTQGASAIRVNNMPPYAAYIYCRKN